jgi:methylenetetrahydrofolate--tRNA-(uracil-5-)-methyltransferase
MLGGLLAYITAPREERFQPMSPNFGLLAPLAGGVKKSERKKRLAERALADMRDFARTAGAPRTE